MQGPRGPKGQRGEDATGRGRPGPPGDKGAVGEQGEKGPKVSCVIIIIHTNKNCLDEDVTCSQILTLTMKVCGVGLVQKLFFLL